jgi:hypothetical protein
MKWTGLVACMGKDEKHIQNLSRESEGKRQLAICSHTLENITVLK